MKKIFYVITLSILCMLSSCEKDKPETENPDTIVGKWELMSASYVDISKDGSEIPGSAVEEDFSHEARRTTYEFKKDGTGVSVEYEDSGEEVFHFEYRVKDDLIILNVHENGEQIKIEGKFVRNGNNLMIEVISDETYDLPNRGSETVRIKETMHLKRM